jgi:hypothetical protein
MRSSRSSTAGLTELLGDVRASCFSFGTATAWVRLSLESGDLAEPYFLAGFDQAGLRVDRHVLESSLDHDMREPGFTLLGGVGENLA